VRALISFIVIEIIILVGSLTPNPNGVLRIGHALRREWEGVPPLCPELWKVGLRSGVARTI
jgi:hypothetical protein